MKNFILVVLVFFTFNSFAQSIKIVEISKNEGAQMLTSIESFEVIQGKQLRLGIIKISNGSGSANLPESDEVSYNMLVSVAHYDENPESKVFSIGPFISPKVLKKVDDGKSITLFIENGIMKRRKISKAIVTEAKVEL